MLKGARSKRLARSIFIILSALCSLMICSIFWESPSHAVTSEVTYRVTYQYPYRATKDEACREYLAGPSQANQIWKSSDPGCWSVVGGYFDMAFPYQTQIVCADGSLPDLGKPYVLRCGGATYWSSGVPQDQLIEQSCPVGNPILSGTGTKIQSEIDFLGAGAHPLALQRVYRSRYLTYGVNGFGLRWMHQWQRRLNVESATAVALRGDGTVRVFSSAYNQWVNKDVRDTLVSIKDTRGVVVSWNYFDASTDRTEIYDASGVLKEVREQNGWKTTLSYSDSSTSTSIAPRIGMLVKVQNQFGQSLSFTYDSTGKIATITLPDSNITRYGYDADGRLATVTWPDGKVRSYHYEDAQSSGALTGITDEAGVRFATWTYDAQGRATSSEHAGGVDKVQVQYLSKSQSVITAADGSSRTYSLELAGNVLRPTGVSAPCPECGNVAKTTAYDASGNVSRRVDFSNQETRYIYDAQGRETQRIEAYGTANAQTTTTEWHPTWRLPTKIASPGRVDYFTYDPKGQPSGYAWFPTNDANGSQGLGATPSGAVTSTGWTYDANGLVSATVEMVGDAVTGQWYFTYDAQGNLLTLTDSDGNVGRALQYDAAGRLLEAINSDGERVRYQYNARGSWTAYEADGRVTNYEYDANGFLTAVRGPGSYYEGYEYDAAHRLTAILRPTTAPQSVDTSNPFGPRATNSPTLPDTEQVQGTWASLWTWLKEWLASWIPSAIAQAGWQRILVPAWPSKSQAPSNAPTSPADELQEGAGIRQNPNTLLQQFDKSLRELATRATEALTCDEDPRCTQARKEASSAYHDLQYKRLPQYLNGGTNGADAGHRNAIIGKQNSLRKAIKKVKLYCATALPLELPEWERVANMEIPILY